MTFLDLFASAVRDRAEHIAVVCDGRRLTYAQLDLCARRVADFFRARGLRVGDRVAIYLENQAAYVYAYLGALSAGLIVVPTNPLYRSRDASAIWEDSQIAALVSGDDLSNEPAARRYGERLVLNGEIVAAAESGALPSPHGFQARPETIALIVFTSGTTGRSKGATISHAAIASNAAAIRAAWLWRPDDVLCIALPLFHVHGLHVGLNTTLINGSTIVIERRFDAERMFETIERERATMFFGVPTMYVRLLERIGPREAPALRLWVSGSAALSAEVWQQFKERFGAQILERYGATETLMCLTNRYGGPRVGGSVGVPFPGVRAVIADPGSGVALPDGAVGELCIHGPNVFSGYLNDPSATAAAMLDIDGARWFRSGDLARFDPDTQTYAIVGRLKELIITGGFNVYPREIEEEIEAYAGVRECAVVGRPDAGRGEVPVAFIAPLEGHAIEIEALLEHLRGRLASFKIPKAVHVLDALPRNAMGKLDKAPLKQQAVEPSAVR